MHSVNGNAACKTGAATCLCASGNCFLRFAHLHLETVDALTRWVYWIAHVVYNDGTQQDELKLRLGETLGNPLKGITEDQNGCQNSDGGESGQQDLQREVFVESFQNQGLL